MNTLARTIAAGAAAGAAGTTVLNAITYLDMALRARPASSTPEESARRLAHALGTELPGDEEQQQNRAAGLGPSLAWGRASAPVSWPPRSVPWDGGPDGCSGPWPPRQRSYWRRTHR
ncbi:hypothetical protein [Sinomonas atrocyanea]